MCRLGDPLFVQRQSNHCRAIAFDQRQHRRQFFRFRRNRVDRRLSVVDTQGRLQRPGVAGVQLQGDIHHTLDALDGLRQECHFVDPGCPDIEVENGSPGLHLFQCLGHKIAEIPVFECLLEAFFARGIEALTNGSHAVHRYTLQGRADKALFLIRNAGHIDPLADDGRQGPDRIGGRAAAAADDCHAGFQCRKDAFHKICIRERIRAVPRIWQSRIGFGGYGQMGIGQDFFQQRDQGIRSRGAVDAQAVCPKSSHGSREDLRCGACKGAPVFLEGHGDQNGQIGVFLRRKQGGFRFIEIGHGFDHDQVCVLSRFYHRRKSLICLFKGQSSQGFEKLSQRANVQGTEAVRGGYAHIADRRLNDVFQGIAGTGKFVGIGSEGVGIDNVAPCPGVVAVHRLNQVRVGDVQQFGNGPGFHAPFLQHGAHGTVEDHKGFVLLVEEIGFI